MDKWYSKLELKSLSLGTVLHNKIDLELRSYNNLLKKIIRQAKIQYYTDQFSKNKSNIRHTWSTIKEILNKCKDEKRFSRILYDKLPRILKTNWNLKSIQLILRRCGWKDFKWFHK